MEVRVGGKVDVSPPRILDDDSDDDVDWSCMMYDVFYFYCVCLSSVCRYRYVKCLLLIDDKYYTSTCFICAAECTNISRHRGYYDLFGIIVAKEGAKPKQ